MLLGRAQLPQRPQEGQTLSEATVVSGIDHADRNTDQTTRRNHLPATSRGAGDTEPAFGRVDGMGSPITESHIRRSALPAPGRRRRWPWPRVADRHAGRAGPAVAILPTAPGGDIELARACHGERPIARLDAPCQGSGSPNRRSRGSTVRGVETSRRSPSSAGRGAPELFGRHNHSCLRPAKGAVCKTVVRAGITRRPR